MSRDRFDVIIVGGSYSGLATGMALGRALKTALIIDNEEPCNRFTPHAHNFLTNDDVAPQEIRAKAKEQVGMYETIRFFNGTAVDTRKGTNGFEVVMASGEVFEGRKLIFATGIKDILPEIDGLQACWGISALHCPYCHGYEVRNKKTGVLGHGDSAFEFVRLISNWTNHLTIFTNGESTLTDMQRKQLTTQSIQVIEKKIVKVEQTNGFIRHAIFDDGEQVALEVIYTPSPFEQHCKIPELMGCELIEEGYLKTDAFHETTVPGVYAVGDNASKMRTLANAVAAGTSVGMYISKKMILEQ